MWMNFVGTLSLLSSPLFWTLKCLCFLSLSREVPKCYTYTSSKKQGLSDIHSSHKTVFDGVSLLSVDVHTLFSFLFSL